VTLQCRFDYANGASYPTPALQRADSTYHL